MAQRAQLCSQCGNPHPARRACGTSPGSGQPIPPHVWQDSRVRDAFARWDLGTASRRIRQLTGIGQRQLAARTGLAQGYLSSVELGHRNVTDVHKVTAFVTGLGVPTELLPLTVTGGKPETLSLWEDDLDPSRPWTATRMVAALDTVAQGGHMLNRRAFLTASGAAFTAYVHHWSIEESEPLTQALSGGRLTPATVASLQQVTDHLRVTDASAGSGQVAEVAGKHLELLCGLRKQGAHDEKTARALDAAIADTATQAGWFHFDTGHTDTAQAYLLAALRAAKASGDVRLGAGALSYLAIHAYSTGHPSDAVTAMRAARDRVAHHSTPALEAMLLTRQARGHAQLGQHHEARRALNEAAEAFHRGPSDNDPHWLYWINTGELHGQSGSCHLALGEPDRAVADFTKAEDALAPNDLRTRGLVLTRAATAHLRAGHPDTAADTARRALDLAERLASTRLTEHLRDLGDEFGAHPAAPYAHDVLERTAALAG